MDLTRTEREVINNLAQTLLKLAKVADECHHRVADLTVAENIAGEELPPKDATPPAETPPAEPKEEAITVTLTTPVTDEELREVFLASAQFIARDDLATLITEHGGDKRASEIPDDRRLAFITELKRQMNAAAQESKA
jgi:hypothetical protein